MNKLFLFPLVLFSGVCFSNFSGFEKGVLVNDSNLNQLAGTSWEYAKSSTTQKKYGDGYAKAFLRPEGTNQLFSLSDSMTLYLTEFETREVAGKWSLTRWQPELLKEDTKRLYSINDSIALNESYNFQYLSGKSILGCLNSIPLRYGDIEEDRLKDIVLFLGFQNYKHDLVIFSPDHERIVFSMRYALQDAINMTSRYQYTSDTRQLNSHPATRIYAKAYLGDFDGDTHPDIVVWRKRYRSLKESDVVEGYELTQQVWQHFERDLDAQEQSEQGITGEYLPQVAEAETIQAWLMENEYTWSQGFPSSSECDSEDGDLIPEMHDPLLNDLEVLK